MKTVFITEKNIKRFNGCTLTYGHFSVIHPGHIRYLNNAKKKSEKLVIALMGNKITSKSIKFKYSQKERADSLKRLDLADAIYLLDEDFLSNAVNLLHPSKLILGHEFKNSNNKEILKAIDLMKRRKGNIYFDAGKINYSSSYFLEDTEEYIKNKRISTFTNTLKKQNISKNNLIESIETFKKGRVFVLGDTIVDQYIDSEPLGISAEAPVIVVKEIKKKNFIGGAAIVASHINSLGSNCNYISVTGDDQMNKLLEDNLISKGIKFNLFKDTKRPTTLKKRYLVDNQKIFRVSKLEDKIIDKELEDKIINLVLEHKKEIDVIVFSDFNYGVITKRIIQEITKIAKENKIKLIGDVQCSSQIGYVTKFKNFDLICANEKEARIALNDNVSGIETLSTNLIKETNVKNLLIKLGSKGFILYQTSGKKEIISQPFPALSAHPIDTAGAGDSVLASMACGIASGVEIIKAAALSCFVSLISVERMGNLPISVKDVLKKIKLAKLKS